MQFSRGEFSGEYSCSLMSELFYGFVVALFAMKICCHTPLEMYI